MVAPTHAGTSTALWRATCGAVVAVVCLSAQQATNSVAKPWGVVGTEDNHSARGGGGAPQVGSPSPDPARLVTNASVPARERSRQQAHNRWNDATVSDSRGPRAVPTVTIACCTSDGVRHSP